MPGIIEPGHFRFSIVGEKVLRLEERLGYTHKGIEKRFEQLSLSRRRTGWPGASRAIPPWPTHGPTAMALESITGCDVAAAGARGCVPSCWSASAIANHLGDLGALGNDAALGLRARSVHAAEGGLAAGVERTAIRPPLA